MNTKVAIYRSNQLDYSETWKDAETFPEKSALQELSRLLGREDGNILRNYIRPGDKVVIKPNWVLDKHPYGLNIFSVITHSAMLRAVADLAWEALDGQGSIVIADAPQWECDFNNLMHVTNVQAIAEYYWKRHRFEISIRDLRQIGCIPKDNFIRTTDRLALVGDPEGYSVVDLGENSAFSGLPNIEALYGADYDRQETVRHHTNNRHEYLVSKTILGADVLINVPKLKVHKKVGVTLNAKAMVGINGNKNWVAHYRVGPPSRGGDEFPDTETALAKVKAGVVRYLTDNFLARKSLAYDKMFDLVLNNYKLIKPVINKITRTQLSVDGGNWHGNDTAWRMTVDLARASLYADVTGKVHDTPQRRFFSFIDGIIAGQKEGPLAPEPKPCGVIIGGESLLGVDIVGACLMGFDWRKLKSLRWLSENAPEPGWLRNPEQEILVISNVEHWNDLLVKDNSPDLAFEPHPAWKGYIEKVQASSGQLNFAER
jgi:uncharacterized protein (DUF362 family)